MNLHYEIHSEQQICITIGVELLYIYFLKVQDKTYSIV